MVAGGGLGIWSRLVRRMPGLAARDDFIGEFQKLSLSQMQHLRL